MTTFIEQQLQHHPNIKPQDVLKMCFQAAYGAEHLLTNLERVRGYLADEFERTSPTNEPLCELIAPEVCRVNIGAWKKLNLPQDWLFNIFVEAAKVQMSDDFYGYVNQWLEYAQNNSGHTLAFSLEEMKKTLEEYEKICDGKPQAVHHSQHYRDHEKPAYRVVSGAFVRLVPILGALAGKNGGVIAIDGRAASGKTTLAAGLKAVLGAEIIHMDDFFLPQELRTAERLAELGGNIHYERFAEEVLPNLGKREYEYQKFDCSTMAYNGTRKISKADWYVVEGSYSHHPHFGNYATVKILSTIDPTTQMERILTRNGKKMAKMFAEKWIPMEEKYLSSLPPNHDTVRV